MIYLFLNCAEYLVSEAVRHLKSELGDPETADLNTTSIEGTKTDCADILGQASMMPFLASRRLILVHGFLSHLEKRMTASKSTGSNAHREAREFINRLTSLPASSDLVLIENDVDKRRQLWKGFSIVATENADEEPVRGLADLSSDGTVTLRELRAPDPKNLPGYVAQRARQMEITIEGRAARILADYVGDDLRRLDNELKKLAAYARGRRIDIDDIKLLVSDASEALIWDLTDAVSQRNGQRAMRSLCHLRRNDASPFYLLTMMARQYRIIVKVKEAAKHGGNEYDIAKAVKESAYPVKKALQQSRHYSIPELTGIMEMLLESDHAMKTGADPDTELDLLIAKLTR